MLNANDIVEVKEGPLAGLLGTVVRSWGGGAVVRITFQPILLDGILDDKRFFRNGNLIYRGHASWRDRNTRRKS